MYQKFTLLLIVIFAGINCHATLRISTQDDISTQSISSALSLQAPCPTLEVAGINPTECEGQGKLNFTLKHVPDGIYTITYDDGSNISGAIQTLIDAARIERRI